MSSLILALVLSLQCMGLVLAQDALGTWSIVLGNAGIATMHAAVTRFDTCIMLDRTNIGPTGRMLENGRCRDQPQEAILKHDCYAHSVMYRPDLKTVRSLFIFTDTWCSSGQFFSDGTLWQTGGDAEGSRRIRTFTPCDASGDCDWVETTTNLTVRRWYATNHLLPEGNRQIVIGGSGQNSYEFVPKRTPTEGVFPLQFLADNCCQSLYPFVFLLPNGELFIFTNMNAIRLNYITNTVTKTYPTIPDNPRNYPSAGSGVLLPLVWQDGFTKAEILICGGAAVNASTKNQVNRLASKSCGRIDPLADAPVWFMETMPIERVMGDMVLLPSGDVLIINGARNGFSGWEKATNAVLFPVSYAPYNKVGTRFTSLQNSTIPRVYHSTANLLPDSKVLCAGSNTHQFYTYTGVYPTELRLDVFSPPYTRSSFTNIRPGFIKWPAVISYNQVFSVEFTVKSLTGTIGVMQHSAPFATHSFSQGQRQLQLRTGPAVLVSGTLYTVDVTAAPNAFVAPPAYYLFFLVQRGKPGTGKWIQQTL
ncbi:hypothetical protein M758_11G034300 [Ceratodon purpureus]|nr:hypothetical protein M758_11G034300 [Ceratodon purpureus]